MVPEKEMSRRPELTQEQLLKLKKGIPACIEFFAADTSLEATKHRDFNLIKIVLVAYCLFMELDEPYAITF